MVFRHAQLLMQGWTLVYLLVDWGSSSKIWKYSWKSPFQHYSVGLCKFCAAWSASPARTIIYTFEQTFLIISTVLCGAIVFMNLGWLKLVFDLQSLPVDWAGVRKYSLVIGFENFPARLRRSLTLSWLWLSKIVENGENLQSFLSFSSTEVVLPGSRNGNSISTSEIYKTTQ